MEILTLPEFGTLKAVALAGSAAARLGASGALTVSPSPPGSGRWDLMAGSQVGIVQAEEVEVRIHPKVAVHQLLFLLSYAADPSGWQRLVTGFAATEDLVETLAYGFVHHAEQALARGVLQGYVHREEALPGLRGRLRESDQLRNRFGLPLPVEVAYDDFTVDIDENQLLRAATRRLLLLRRLTPLRPRLRRLAHELDQVSDLPLGRPLPTVRFTRLNERYRPAVRLAELILRSGGIRFGEGVTTSVAFLFDMYVVFEDFLTAALREAFETLGGRVQAQHRWSLDVEGGILIRPDVTWWDGPLCRGVVDAKYKSLASKALPNADVYQLFAYCTAYGLHRGHLVYAAGNEEPSRYRVRNSGVELSVHALDLGRAPGYLLSDVQALAHLVAATHDHARLEEPA